MQSSQVIFEIIAISWLSCLMVAFYVNRAIDRKLPIRKPFGCEKCWSFWMGIIYFSLQGYGIKEIFIFASLTSLLAYGFIIIGRIR